jgi:hypothetical protein
MRYLLALLALATPATAQTVQSSVTPNVWASLQFCSLDKLYHFKTEACPSGFVPSPSLDGAAYIPDNADPKLALQPSWGSGAIPPSSKPDVIGALRFICTAGQVLADDPIVYPGQPGKSHLHQFYGNTARTLIRPIQSLRTTGTEHLQPRRQRTGQSLGLLDASDARWHRSRGQAQLRDHLLQAPPTHGSKVLADQR